MKSTSKILLLSASLALIGAASCKKVPDYVLDQDEMASLLIDIHKGESVIEYERSRYGTDSLKKLMKQSVYARHGVTAETVDTSFVWYGNHIEDYLKVYDVVIERLEDELAKSNAPAEAPVFAAGDSVDVWGDIHRYRLSGNQRLGYLSFDIKRDDNWDHGDNYHLQFKLINSKPQSKFKYAIFARYDDGTVESKSSVTSSDGWSKMRLVTDSTKTAVGIFGYVYYDVAPGETVFLDSVALVRTRRQPSNYYQRNGLRSFKINQ